MEMLFAAGNLVEAAIRDDFCAEPVGLHDQNLLDLVKLRFAGKGHERVLAVFFDGQQRLLLDEVIAEGCAGLAGATARSIFSRAFACDAAGVMLAHNHPSGDWRPSSTDVKSTEQLRVLAGSLGIELLDHLIVAGTRIYSMRAGDCL